MPKNQKEHSAPLGKRRQPVIVSADTGWASFRGLSLPPARCPGGNHTGARGAAPEKSTSTQHDLFHAPIGIALSRKMETERKPKPLDNEVSAKAANKSWQDER